MIDEYGCIDTKLIRTGVMKFYDADGRTIRSINENGDGCTIYYYPVTPVTNTHKKMREDKFSFADDGSVNGMETIWYDIQGEPIRALQQDGTIITYADITSWWDVQNAYIFSDAQYEEILILAKT